MPIEDNIDNTDNIENISNLTNEITAFDSEYILNTIQDMSSDFEYAKNLYLDINEITDIHNFDLNNLEDQDNLEDQNNLESQQNIKCGLLFIFIFVICLLFIIWFIKYFLLSY